MIRIIPSMAVSNGKVVKTVGGNIDELKIYDKNPLDLAMEFEDNGLKRLHLIDLEGAKKRKVINYNVLETITKYTKLEVDYSGGVTSDGDVRTVFEFGAKYFTTATVAVHEQDKFLSWLITYGGNKVILAADSLEGVVLTRGWQRNTGIDLIEHLAYYEQRGVRYVKSTEIARDGTLLGPHFELYKKLVARFPDLRFSACGGIRTVDDIEELNNIGLDAVIIGKSFYEGRINLKDLHKFLV